MKVTGVPYEEIARSRRRDRVLGAGARRGDRRRACSRRRGRSRAEMLAHGTTTFEAKTGYGLSREGELRARAAGAASSAPTRVTGLFAHAVPPGFDRRRVDGRGRRAGRRGRRRRARHLRRVGRLHATSTSRGWARSPRREGVPLRAHVEQFNANRSVPVALAAGARSVDHLACLHPDDLAPLAAAECAAVLLPGAEFLGAEEIAPGRALADAGAICVLATDCNPGTSPVLVAAARDRARRAPLRLDGARGAGRLHAQRGVGARPVRRCSARSRSASAPTCSCSTARSSTSRYRFGRNPVPRRWSPAGEFARVITADRPRARCSPTSCRSGCDEDGATTRLAWTREDEAAAGWFARRAGASWAARWSATRPATCGRARTRPGRGGRPARTWTPCARGGRFDGALGVAAAFAVAERRRAARGRSRSPTRRARASTRRRSAAARWSAGSTATDALDRVDEHGVALGDAMADAGVDPERLGDAPAVARAAARLPRAAHRPDARPRRGARARRRGARLAARLRLQAELDRPRRPRGHDPREPSAATRSPPPRG